ncbi:Erg28 like protein [Hibiscus syriacus]|uniref:Erg28 like protein n=1 Tax=Hibiscus syriacus TaxID=106335 RepID=A0A6A3C7K1_HIBSY|nr:Erg28 like protein [Hibiscus syriacus]
MDPCPFVRILIDQNSELPSPSGFGSCYQQQQQQRPEPRELQGFLQKPLAACFSLSKSEIGKIVCKGGSTCKLCIEVYADPDGSTCGLASGKLLGRVSVPVDLLGAESRPAVVRNGWIDIGRNRTTKMDHVQGNVKQAVFTCKFGFRSSSDRNLGSRSSSPESSASRNWLPSMKNPIKISHLKNEKGGQPFEPRRVVNTPSGVWDLEAMGRLEAWRESGFTDALGYRFDIFHDDIAATVATTTVSSSALSTKLGGKFTMDMTTNVLTPSTSPQGSCDFGSGSRPGSRAGSGSGSDFGFGSSPSPLYRVGGFVMSSTVEGVGNCSKPEVEVGVQHVTCTEDAAAFVALAAAMDLSMDACRSFSQKLRKELRQEIQNLID